MHPISAQEIQWRGYLGLGKDYFPVSQCVLEQKTLPIIVATAVPYNFVRGRNDPIEEKSLEDHDENPLPAMNDLARPFGNATRRALIIQHLTLIFVLVTATHFVSVLNVIHVCITV